MGGVAPAARRQEKRERREMLLRVLFMVEAASEAKSFSISSSVRPLVSGTVVVVVVVVEKGRVRSKLL